MAILEDLLSKGYLPVQLPPGFSSASFASALPGYERIWEQNGEPPATLPERYSVARSSFYRRITSIVNPIGFYFLAKEIATYWSKIEDHYSKTSLSRSIPVFGDSLRAIRLKKFSELYEEKVTSAAGFKFALVTDISSFFPTIYTHTIPWALHTKAIAKAKRARVPKYFGNILDARSMSVQDGQTIGLPIGPDTSHIIAEIIAVAIDERLRAELGGWPSGFRYVDDFFLFFDRREDAEKALAAVTRAVSSFELQVSAAKTRIIEVKELVEESWKYGIRKLKIASARKPQRHDIHHYFEFMFALEHRFKDESLIKYGLKQLSSRIVKRSNWSVFEAYLLKCGFGFPNTIQLIAHILSTYGRHGYPVNREAIGRFCNNLISTSAAADHHGEVSWLLWICKELSIRVESDPARASERMGSPLCTLILLDMQNAGLLAERLDAVPLAQMAAPDALLGSGWLLSYEAGRREWLGLENDRFISEHEYFGPLNSADVAFYDDAKLLSPIFEFKEPTSQRDDAIFDTDEEIEDSFDFDDMDEEYFDSVDSKDSESDADEVDTADEF